MDSNDQGGADNPGRFTFIDPSLTDRSFFITANRPPWGDDQPDDQNNENAVE